MENDNSPILPLLLLNARPAAGKSEIIDFLKNTPAKERADKYHIGKIKVIDDFPFLWRWFEEDDLLTEMGKPRLYTDENGYFKAHYYWDLLIKLINLEYSKFMNSTSNSEEFTAIIEFSRGQEHGGYQHALPLLSVDILKPAASMYVDVSWEESLRKNRKRFNPNKPDSILEHSLPEEKMQKLYSDCDFKSLPRMTSHYVRINEFNIPYVIFDNQDDVTFAPGSLLADRLIKALDLLYLSYQTKSTAHEF